MLIDFHTHCFPDALAPRAIEKLSFAGGGLEPYTNGTVSDLHRSMREHGVDVSVVLNIATNPRQQKNVNDFAAAINGHDIVAFGSVYPDSPDAMDEIDRIRDLGLRGVKLHPDYQGFSVDDPRYKPLYRKISSLGLITLFHAGHDIGFPPPYGGTPDKMAKIIDCFDTPVIAAHWGGAVMSADVLKYLCGSPLYFDTSFGYSMMPKYYALKIIEKHGVERMLFGTDSPWHTAEMERRLLSALALSDAELAQIYGENAKRLLKM
jgi:predicted TIM-barrel fold metal-dependent hydrolase